MRGFLLLAAVELVLGRGSAGTRHGGNPVRGLQGGSTESWRLIIDPPGDGRLNMAVDESLAAHAAEGGPVLRLYGWGRPTLSIGYAQDYADVGRHAERTPVVRRITGGRAVLHDRELTYSVAVPAGHHLFSGGPLGAYHAVSSAISDALNDLGVPAALTRGEARSGPGHAACFRAASKCEVAVNGAKIAGSAQRRFKDAVLLHGSVLIDVDEAATAELFGAETLGKMAWVAAYRGLGAQELRPALVCRMAGRLGAEFTPVRLSPAEQDTAGLLLARRYSTDSWTMRAGRPDGAGRGAVGRACNLLYDGEGHGA